MPPTGSTSSLLAQMAQGKSNGFACDCSSTHSGIGIGSIQLMSLLQIGGKVQMRKREKPPFYLNDIKVIRKLGALNILEIKH